MAGYSSRNVEECIKKFHTNGFVVLPGVIPLEEIHVIHEAVFLLLQKYAPERAEKCTEKIPWLSSRFHEELNELKKEQPDVFSALYDSLQTHSVIQAIGISKAMLKFAAKLLQKNSSHLSWINLSNTPPLFRMDQPINNAHALDWHQERVSYDQNEDGSNGLLVWIPLQDVNKRKGTMDICVGSHKAGFLDPTHSGAPGSIHSEKKFISEDICNKYKQVNIEMNAGDVLFASMLTLHKSGAISDSNGRFRLTVTTRLHNSYSNDFRPGRIRFVRPN